MASNDNKKAKQRASSTRTRPAESKRALPSVSESHKTGERVLVLVTRVAPFGVFVELVDDGSQGMIRRRELSWDREVNPLLLLQPGDKIEALVLRQEPGTERLELSYRQAVWDLWQDFPDTYREGAVVRGTVKRLRPNGAYVDIDSGVDGWLPVNEIAIDDTDGNVDQYLWLGDTVEAVIVETDRRRRHIGLSLRERLRQIDRDGVLRKLDAASSERDTGTTLGEAAGVSANALKARFYGDPGPSSTVKEIVGRLQRRLRVLVVDDEPSVRSSLAERLGLLNCQCVTAEDGREALEAAFDGDYDVMFVDIGLPDTDGVSLAGEILTRRPEAQVVMVTSIALADEHASQLEDLDILGVLLKPLDPEEIQDLLDAVARRQPLAYFGYTPARQEDLARQAGFLRTLAWRKSFASLEDALRVALAAIRAATGAQGAAVFSMDPSTRSASLVAQEGEKEIAYNPAKHSLEISPVKDVVLDHEYILETNVSANAAAKFKYVLPLFHFDSFIGVPIEARGEIRHGLFLFHGQRNAFSEEDFQRALAASIAVGAIIEHAILDQTMLEFQNLSLQGQLSAGLAHEVNNKLSGILLRLKNATDRCRMLERDSANLSSSREMASLRKEIEEVTKLASTVRQTARMFQVLMRPRAEDVTSVNPVLRTTTGILAALARKHNIEIVHHLDTRMPGVPAIGVRLEQAFLNIMLNAVQQIATYSPSGGSLEIETRYEGRDGARPVKVRFRDDGPGIHRQLFDRIFDMGFTTREGGSGLGLYITQGLIESIGGRVSVEDSIILLGTTFLVELPIAHRNGG